MHLKWELLGYSWIIVERMGDAETDQSRGAFHYEDGPELNPSVGCEIQ